MSDKSPLLDDEHHQTVSDTVEEHHQNRHIQDLPHQPQKIECEDIITTPLRWYILAVFCATGFMQNIIWNTWGPIAESAELVFGWEDSTIALMNNWGPITYVGTAFFFSWLMDVKGFRISIITSCTCMTLGAMVRCGAYFQRGTTCLNITVVHSCIISFLLSTLSCVITTLTQSVYHSSILGVGDPVLQFAVVATVIKFIHIGQFINGIAGPVLGAGPPLLSAIWFPVHQRITSTAVGNSVGIMGTALAFVLGPAVVSDIENKTECANSSSSLFNQSNCHHKIDQMRSQIMMLITVEAAVPVVILVLTIIYFPTKPSHTPSITASLKRTDFTKGVRDLVRNVKFWILVIPYAVSCGVFMCWQSVLDVNLKPSGINQHTAGWIGFWSTMAGQFVAIAVGIFADKFAKKMKLMFISLYIVAALMFLVFTFVLISIIPMYTALLYTTSIIGSMCLFATLPLYYELGCETSYPVAEGITNTVMTFSLNVVALLFLLVFLIPNIGTVWTNWCLVGSVVGCVPIFAFIKPKYRRFDIDTVIETEVSHNT